MNFSRLSTALVLTLAAPYLAASADRIEHIATVTHPDLGEMSGLVASSYPGIYWVHNDSGDSARLFAIDLDGNVVIPSYISERDPNKWSGHAIDAAWNSDWEAIAMSDGVLYIADVGNNGNARRDLGIYVVNEFHPEAIYKARTARFLPLRYPDQKQYPAALWHFDCEAVFTADGKLYFITKHRQPGQPAGWERGVKLYRLDTQHTDRDNILTLVDRHEALTLATGADLSPDGSRLAVLSYTHLWVFDRPAEGDKWLQSNARVLELPRDVVKQNEAIAWENDETLLFSNENREIFRVPLGAIPPVD